MTSQARLPYSFARRHGVLMMPDEQGLLTMVHRKNAPTSALLEACRVVGTPQRVRKSAEDEFDHLLAQQYQDSGGAEEVFNDIGDDLDLAELANALGDREPEDLMESEDDAPVIRLINAMLTEAVRHNASDIHVEPFEKSLIG